MSGVKNRDRLLELISIFHNETDEEHTLSLMELKLRLEESLREPVSTGAIMDDIRYLRERRPVLEQTVAHGQKRYSMPRTDFETYELRLLVDAIASARSITPKETKKLITKIKSLTSRHIGMRLDNQIYLDDRIKESNEFVKYYINDIHHAIGQQYKIKFQYSKYTSDKKRQLLHDGQMYSVAPYGLIWSNDYYYVVGQQDGYSGVKTFRVDRMEKVYITSERFRKPDFSVTRHINETFNMYPGQVDFVEIQFDNHLINVVIDRFGKNVRMSPVDESTFKILIKAAVSDGLVRWLLTWGGDAKVISPAILVERMKREAEKLMRQYQE